ncbi:MAG: riboflavin synthase [Desulfobacteraceae bacterium]|nr:MAG: riboflavin synthase [Desulfobacteraceae bacterium]
MFTGIIEGLGTLSGIRPVGQGRRLAIASDFSIEDSEVGESISVNGACLTAVSISGPRFEADVSPETLAKTTFGRAGIGDRLNLERALRFSDRLGGHMVTGHIDGIGTILRKEPLDNAVILAIELDASVARYLIPKGSVAVDGVSLTVNKRWETGFEVSIIPHTLKMTTLQFKGRGNVVNIETDMIGKYVERFLKGDPGESRSSRIDMEFLGRTGFL